MSGKKPKEYKPKDKLIAYRPSAAVRQRVINEHGNYGITHDGLIVRLQRVDDLDYCSVLAIIVNDKVTDLTNEELRHLKKELGVYTDENFTFDPHADHEELITSLNAMHINTANIPDTHAARRRVIDIMLGD